MTHNIVTCRFSEQRYMILNLFTFFGTPGRRFHLHAKLISDFFQMSLQLILTIIEKYVMDDLRNWTKV